MPGTRIPTVVDFRRRAAARKAIRAELAALARRADEADLPSIALVIDLALAVDSGEWPPEAKTS